MIKTRLVKLLSNSKKYIYLNIIIQWVALVAQMLAIFTITSFIADVFESSVPSVLKNIAIDWVVIDVAGVYINWTMLALVLITLALLIAIRMICDKLLARINYLASADVKKVLRDKIYEKILKLGPSYKEKISSAEVVQLSTEGVEQLETYFGKYLPQLFYSLLAPLTLFISLVHVNVKASVVLLICVPLIPISIVVVQKIAKRLLNKYWGIYTELGDSFLDNLNGLTTLKVYQSDERKAQEMDKESDRFRKITMKVLTMQLNSTSVMDIVAYGGAAVGMVVVMSEYFKGNVGLAGTLSIILLSSEFFIPLRRLGSYFHIAMNGMAASDKIFALLDMEEPAKGSLELAKSDGAILSFMKGAKADSINILMENVEFGYEAERKVLDGINLMLPSGSFIALVGESGSGKSTIASLLTGKNKDFKGTIKINGLNISDIRSESLLSNITLVRSNSYLFKGTVRQNLRLAKPEATDEEMWRVLDLANLSDVLRNRDGLDTMLNERATNLSGGQAQRLCVARALLSDTPMYIFDEATSNIDAESEEIIMDVIHKLSMEKTILLISHRLKNVEDADCIYMLADGKIVESGKHSELILNVDKTDKESIVAGYGAYARLYNAQATLENFRRNETSQIEVVDARAGVCLYSNNAEPTDEELEEMRRSKEEKQRREALLKEKRDRIRSYRALQKVHNSLYETKGHIDTPNDGMFDFSDFDYLDDEELIKSTPVKISTKKEVEVKRRSGIAIMFKLIGLIKPLIGIMFLAIILGTIGYLCAISLTIFSTGIVTELWGSHFEANGNAGSVVCGLTASQRQIAYIILIVVAVLRGFLHYAEQYCNHFIAFKLLAIIRHKVFATLRRLAPAKLDSKDRGNLVSLITSDIELLEVFYAHTISPIAIAILVSIVMLIFFAHISSIAAVIAALAYITVGIIIPVVNGKLAGKAGMEFRTEFGELNSYCLDSLRGIDETIQYNGGLARRLSMAKKSNQLSRHQLVLSRFEGTSTMLTDMFILLASYIMFVVTLFLADNNAITFTQSIVCTVAMMGSFGPVVALSSLSNNLTQTLASGERVLSLVEEEPEVEEIENASDINSSDRGLKLVAKDVTFAYNDKEILRDYNAVFKPGKITGIHGESGCGKSTLLKLMMRFHEVNAGTVSLDDKNVNEINTSSLRKNLSFVSQETELFNDTIASNIAIAKPDATKEEIIEAAKKASIHDFIESLPNGYDTVIGELGDILSGGEKQRIGVARAFLHDAPVILMDEPTSNLDSLNEGIILKSLANSSQGKTIVIVSHRASTMNVVDIEVVM
mgnify:CR=1 FL=1